MSAPGPPPREQVPPRDPSQQPPYPPQPAPPARGLDQELGETIDMVRQEVPTSLEGMERLPLSLLLILLGGGLAILLGLLFFLFDLFGRHPLAALIDLMVCLIFGAALVVTFALTRRNRKTGAILSGVFALVLVIGGGTAGFIGGLLGLAGAGIVLLREFGILDR